MPFEGPFDSELITSTFIGAMCLVACMRGWMYACVPDRASTKENLYSHQYH